MEAGPDWMIQRERRKICTIYVFKLERGQKVGTLKNAQPHIPQQYDWK